MPTALGTAGRLQHPGAHAQSSMFDVQWAVRHHSHFLRTLRSLWQFPVPKSYLTVPHGFTSPAHLSVTASQRFVTPNVTATTSTTANVHAGCNGVTAPAPRRAFPVQFKVSSRRLVTPSGPAVAPSEGGSSERRRKSYGGGSKFRVNLSNPPFQPGRPIQSAAGLQTCRFFVSSVASPVQNPRHLTNSA
jgi:hypothetical protein